MRRWIFIISLLCVLIGLSWVVASRHQREPVYRGKALTRWLENYISSSRPSRAWNEADDAVRHVGTNCIPILLEMLEKRDSKLKLRLLALAQKQRFVKIRFIPAAHQNIAASRAFIVLGDRARDAVPALMKAFEGNLSTDSQTAIADALAWIGPSAKPAIPLLLQAATNSNPRVRANALWALGEIHAEPELCVPKLIHALKDSDNWARLSAAHALGMFGAAAKAAIPALSELANTQPFANGGMGIFQGNLEARNALTKIGSQSQEFLPDFGLLTSLEFHTNTQSFPAKPPRFDQ
jgi:hypothetical protein